MDKAILHCDLNNFYASVECLLDPTLAGKAVVVSGSVDERHGVVLAKNDKAKACGVITGEAVWQAKQKCPNLTTVAPHYDQYMKFSKLTREICERYTDQIESYGIDECWLDVTGSGIMGTGKEIAHMIRKDVKRELGLTVSVGVSFNKIFAKLGSDMKKPDAVTCIDRETFREKIWTLPAAEMLGIGKATNKKLAVFGIRTIGQVAQAPDDFWRLYFGKNGMALKRYANGEDNSAVAQVVPSNITSPVKSVSHGVTTIKDLENSAEVWCVMLELVQGFGTSLREHKKKARGIAISIRNNEFFTKEWQCRLPHPTQSPTTLAQTAFALFERSYDWRLPIRSVTVRVIGLEDEDVPFQYDFFNDATIINKRERLDLAIESIRSRFGNNAIRNAVLCGDIKMSGERNTEMIVPTGMLR